MKRDELERALRIPPSAEERAVLAMLLRRHGEGPRYWREAVLYLTGRTRHTAPRMAPPPPGPQAYVHVVDDRDALVCAYASDWVGRQDDMVYRPPVDVRAAEPGEEPATFRVDDGALTAVDAPQWLRNAVRAAFSEADEFFEDWEAASPESRVEHIRIGTELAQRARSRAGI